MKLLFIIVVIISFLIGCSASTGSRYETKDATDKESKTEVTKEVEEDFDITPYKTEINIEAPPIATDKLPPDVFRLAIVGLGTGIFISPNNSSLMGAAPKTRQGIAAGILATSRNFGMVLGVGLAGAVFTTVLSHAGDASRSVLYKAIQITFIISGGLAVLGLLVASRR